MRIPDSKIDEVRNSSDIVDIVSSYVNLRKRGKNFVGLCPFHKEKTPSFTVSAEKQMYHCFGCGAGGNVFTFVMEHEKVSFVEAVRSLARRAGISLPEEGNEDRALATENEKLYDICRAAELHFQDNLTGTVEGKLALEYARHRGFSDETIREFGLGYAMNAWDDLVRFASGRNLDLQLVEKAGLVIRRDESTSGAAARCEEAPLPEAAASYYDRFRGRMMFPIYSASGRTIGFGARKLREDDPLGKYINSPETPIYNKSRTLYGLFQAREAIREKEYAILVEGYADLISVSQAGIGNVVASSGTALTDEQILLLGRYARNIALVYDADSAGSKATIRGADLIIEKGLDVKVAELPQGEDPDSFVRKEGGAAFEQLLRNAASFLDFTWNTFQSQGLLATPEGKTRAVRSIVQTIARMGDEIKRNFYIKSISEKYGIYESVLFREVERLLGRERGRARIEERRGVDAQQTLGENGPAPQTPGFELSASERDLLKVILEVGGEMLQFVSDNLGPAGFTHPLARKIVDMIGGRPGYSGGSDVKALMDGVDDEELRRFIADLTFSKYDISKGWGKVDEPDPWEVAEKSILKLRTQEIDRQVAERYRLMKEAGSRGEDLVPFQEEIRALQQQKKELQNTHLAKRSEAS